MNGLVKSVLITVLALVFTLGLSANGLNLNGNGSKAIAMGGAFVGLADDYSAIFWNPAGLTQMKQMSLSLFVTDVIPSGSYKWDLLGIDAATKTSHYISPGLGFFKPIGENIVLGIYAYVPSGIGAHWDGDQLKKLTSGGVFNWKSMFAIATISPAIAIKLSDKFSIGGTLNINYGLLKVERPALGQYKEDLNGMAVGATIGMLYKPIDILSIGLTYRTPVTAKLSGESEMPGAAALGLPGKSDAEREATFPMWIAGGICLRPTNQLTITADLQYTNWKELTHIPIYFDNPGWKVYFESATSFELKWKDTVQVRFGLEYKLSDTFAIRGGYYHDPVVAPVSTHNILLPELGYNFITGGFGYDNGKIKVDFSLEYGFGTDVTVSIAEADPRAGMPGVHGMNIFVPNIAFTIML